MDLKIKEINIKTERKVESLESLGYSFEAGVWNRCTWTQRSQRDAKKEFTTNHTNLHESG